MFAPGVFGVIALVLALYAMHMLPINFAGFLLIVVALVLFVLEAKYPTHGVLGVGGVLAMVLGALFLINSPLTGGGVSLSAALGVPLEPGIILLDPQQADGYVRDWHPPGMEPIRHWSYAVQWWSFGVVLLVLWIGLNLRKAGQKR